MLRCPFPLRCFQFIIPKATGVTRRPCSSAVGLVEELSHRGLLADHTASQEILSNFLKDPRVVYCGIDPTAGSLHVGNLLPLLTLLHFQLRGHQAIALLGGATALIGDPSGRDEERPVQSADYVQQNAAKIEKQLLGLFENANNYAQKRITLVPYSPQPVTIVNNIDWWRDLSLVEFLRSTGKFVRLSSMLSKESVKSRMAASSGISFAEFSYQLLQAHDFWHLYKHHACSIQLGGSDQWGNIVAGLDVIARQESKDVVSNGGKAYGITTPLLTTSSGQKFGKSAGNAVWLDRQRTGVFDFYQFFLRTVDADVESYLNFFTLLGPEEVKVVMAAHRAQPEMRLAQRKLASEVTELIHGEAGVSQAQAATRILFDAELGDVNPEVAAEALRYDPRYHLLHETELFGIPLTKLAASSGLTRSRAEAVRLIEAGGLYLNNRPVRESDRKMQIEDLLRHQMAVLRAGKDKHVVLALK